MGCQHLLTLIPCPSALPTSISSSHAPCPISKPELLPQPDPHGNRPASSYAMEALKTRRTDYE
jgi:hypothetical protein